MGRRAKRRAVREHDGGMPAAGPDEVNDRLFMAIPAREIPIVAPAIRSGDADLSDLMLVKYKPDEHAPRFLNLWLHTVQGLSEKQPENNLIAPAYSRAPTHPPTCTHVYVHVDAYAHVRVCATNAHTHAQQTLGARTPEREGTTTLYSSSKDWSTGRC